MFQQDIIDSLKKEVKGDISLEIPPDSGMGDYAFSCFYLAKEWRDNPANIAKHLVKKIKKPESIELIIAVGPYVNFYLHKTKLAEKVLTNIHKEKEKYGSSKEGLRKNVVVEFSSPNVAKPFHIGHLRSTIIGNSIAKMHEFLGYKSIRLNYIGDWGTQFGVVLAAYLKWGDKEKLKKDPIQHLVEIYVRYTEAEKKDEKLHDEAKTWFKKLEQGDKEALQLWAKFKHLSIDEFRRIYKILNVEFDSYDGEAFIKDKVNETLEFLKKKKVAKIDEGALIVPLEGMTPCMLLKSDETTTYASRDLAGVQYRLKTYCPEKIIIVTGSEQILHFQQVFEVAKKVGWTSAELVHVNSGFYLDKAGKKLSTRAGKIIVMEEMLNEVIDLALKTINEKNSELKNKEEVARQIGVGALIFGDLVNDRIKDVVFDIERILDFEGDTAPYLQYTHARACSILRKAKEQGLPVNSTVSFASLKEKTEQHLIKELSRFNDVVKDSLKQYKPHILAQYLIKLSKAFNEFYHACPCLQEKNEDTKKARLLLIDSSRQVIHNGLSLLGIESPEEM